MTIKYHILLLFAMLLGLSCQISIDKEKKVENNLKIKLKVTGSGVVGYGSIYRCQVLEVLEGKCSNETISLTLIDDSATEGISLDSLPINVIVNFKKGKENEPYQIMPINGFVDNNSTSWIITEMALF